MKKTGLFFKDFKSFSALFLSVFFCGIAHAEQCQITSPLPVPVLLTGCTYSGALPPNSTSYIQNTLTPTTTTQLETVEISSVTQSLDLPYLAPNLCLHTSTGGFVTTSAGDCGAGNGLEVLAGVNRTTSTITLGFPGPPFVGAVTGSSMTVTLDGSSVTMRGQAWSNTVDATTGTFNTRLNNLDTSTATLTTRLIAVGISTASIAVDTGTLTTRIIAVGISTAAIAADTGTMTTRLIAIGVSTAAIAVDTGTLTTRIIAVGVSTAAIALDTGTLTTRIIAVGVSTAAIAVDTGTLTNRIISVGISTAAIAVDTGTLTTRIIAVGVSTAAIASSTGTLALNFPVSLSTNSVGVLPSAQMVSTSAFITSSQTFTGAPTFISSTTHLGALVISSTTILGLSPGTTQQLYTSAGPGLAPYWSTVTSGSNGT